MQSESRDAEGKSRCRVKVEMQKVEMQSESGDADRKSRSRVKVEMQREIRDAE